MCYKTIIYSLLLFVLLINDAVADSTGKCYLIVIDEGVYPSSDTMKYGASITVYPNCDVCSDVKPIGKFHGSTLPNPYWYYKYYDGSEWKAFSKEGDLQKVFIDLSNLQLYAVGLEAMKPILEVYNEDKKWPIIASGEYTFDIAHLMSWKSQPKALSINGGALVTTVNPNPIQNNQYKADKIWIHKGTKEGVNRGSEGCLTINPDEWQSFIDLFPSDDEWVRGHYSGKLFLLRGHDPKANSAPCPPRNLRIVP